MFGGAAVRTCHALACLRGGLGGKKIEECDNAIITRRGRGDKGNKGVLKAPIRTERRWWKVPVFFVPPPPPTGTNY